MANGSPVYFLESLKTACSMKIKSSTPCRIIVSSPWRLILEQRRDFDWNRGGRREDSDQYLEGTDAASPPRVDVAPLLKVKPLWRPLPPFPSPPSSWCDCCCIAVLPDTNTTLLALISHKVMTPSLKIMSNLRGRVYLNDTFLHPESGINE